MGARWERLLAVASVCLPIPLLAATGLSIPLPSSVERIGAALVAWVDEGPEAAPLPVSGDIVLTEASQSAPELRDQIAVAARAAVAETVAASGTTSTAESRPNGESGKGAQGGSGTSGGSGGSSGSGGSTGGGTAPPPPPPPGPVEGTVNEVTKTTEPVVDVVDDTVGGLGETVDGVTEDLLGDEGLLGGGGLLGSGK
jgi:hypothetical protein